jgi:hypothetical protein
MLHLLNKIAVKLLIAVLFLSILLFLNIATIKHTLLESHFNAEMINKLNSDDINIILQSTNLISQKDKSSSAQQFSPEVEKELKQQIAQFQSNTLNYITGHTTEDLNLQLNFQEAKSIAYKTDKTSYSMLKDYPDYINFMNITDPVYVVTTDRLLYGLNVLKFIFTNLKVILIFTFIAASLILLTINRTSWLQITVQTLKDEAKTHIIQIVVLALVTVLIANYFMLKTPSLAVILNGYIYRLIEKYAIITILTGILYVGIKEAQNLYKKICTTT